MTLSKPKIFPFPHFFRIEPSAPFFDSPHFLRAIQNVVEKMIPEKIWMMMTQGGGPGEIFSFLTTQLPLFHTSEITDASKGFEITYLCPAEYTHRARRYVLDTLRKWLIPPKQAEITGGMSLIFQFSEDPKKKFLIAQDFIAIRNQEELKIIQKNLPDLIHQLKEKLPCEFLRHSDNSVHQIFMPRNEEEIIRGLIVLSNQIKFVRDLPQVSIHFDKQTDTALSFTVIIAKLLKPSMEPLRKVLAKSDLKMDIDDVRVMGYLKKQKYPKEAALLRFTLEKRSFFRPDYSVDLLKARQTIVSSLKECLGNFRDFNGGMILKQDEALFSLRKELGALPQKEEFLLENYFYSLCPAIMQTVYDTAVLKTHFNQLKALITQDRKVNIEQTKDNRFAFSFLSAPKMGFKDQILKAIAPLQLSSRNLTISSFEFERIYYLGFIFSTDSEQKQKKLQQTIQKAFTEWRASLFEPI